MKITISPQAKKRLIEQWGPEVILKCSCRQVPSHSMWGQKGKARCPICKETCEVIFQDWGVVQNG